MAIDPGCVAEAEARARADYAAPGRYYHDQRHLGDCLGQLDEIEDLSERGRRLLRWAILWHDVVYDPQRSDNEQLSAARASRELLDCGIDPAEASEIERLILLTKSHRADQGDKLGALLVSIDLSILGAEPERYAAYAEAVRDEYAHVPDDAWRLGRSAVLEALLGVDPLYPDPRFRAALEDRARRNIAGELEKLGAG